MKIGLIFPSKTPTNAHRRPMSQFQNPLVRWLLSWSSRNVLPSGINLVVPDDGGMDIILSLTYPHLAALTPPGHEIKIINENVQEIDFEEDFDLIGITVWTAFARRAYELAAHYRSKGSKVVLGGPHVTLLPEEGIRYADSVVIGEGELTWPQAVDDALKGELKSFYSPPRTITLSDDEGIIPAFPRRDLVDKSYYVFQNLVLTGRGCPFDCHFCSVTTIYGAKYRHRSVESVINEISNLKEKFFIFIDDNLFGNRPHAKELFKALTPLKKIFRCEATINIARNEEMVSLLADAGCQVVSVGVESLSSENITEMHKLQNNPEEYGKAIKLFHKYGIGFWAGLIMGFDEDDIGVGERMISFCVENNVDFPMLNILIPYPTTKLYYRIKQEGRLFHEDWNRYTGRYAVFQPKKMSPEELEQLYVDTMRKLYSVPIILRRISHWGILTKKWWRYLTVNMAIKHEIEAICDARQAEIDASKKQEVTLDRPVFERP